MKIARLSLVIAFVLDGLADARSLPRSDALEFFRLLDQITPRFLRRKAV